MHIKLNTDGSPKQEFIAQASDGNWPEDSPAPRYVIDLFCGEGGAANGYSQAGFTVVGVDSSAERIARYPYSAYLGDWETGIFYWLNRLPASSIAFVHASPPCQAYSAASEMARARGVAVRYPDLIPPVRKSLSHLSSVGGFDYVIENVVRAPLQDPVILCGSMFGREANWHGDRVGLKRHRGFETTFPVNVFALKDDCGSIRSVPVYGHGAPGYREGDPYFKGRGFARLTREVMGIDWMTRRGLTEAIPPAYSEFIGNAWKEVNI
jgi:DNA (cytosine-5)-methyltransferase 1